MVPANVWRLKVPGRFCVAPRHPLCFGGPMRARLRRQRNDGSGAGAGRHEPFVTKIPSSRSPFLVTASGKYVNMADINFPTVDGPPPAPAGDRAAHDPD